MSEAMEEKIHICYKCETRNTAAEVAANQYRCIGCGHDLAHVDTAPNGAVRGVFGWLKQEHDVIGERYRVQTVLGKGGFGATYLVEDLRVNNKRRALKEIPELLFDEYEVSLLSGLEHPSIPDIADRFNEGGMVYLVLKFGGSRTLQSECRSQQRIPYATLKPWALQLANALQYLHSRTPPIIHRDLKPENVLLDEADRVMLIDFGIAKESSSGMTRTLGRAASLGYSPPEQVLGTGTDQRSDIYAYAATLYFALTGQVPAAAHERVAGKPLIPVVELAPDIPAAVDAALTRALNLNINERQANIEELIAVLEDKPQAAAEALMGGQTVKLGDIAYGPVLGTAGIRSQPLPGYMGTAPVQPSAPNRWPLWAGAALAIALLVGGAVYLTRDKGKEEASAVAEQPTPVQPAPIQAAQPVTAPTAAPSAVVNVAPTVPAAPAPSAATAPPPATGGGSALETLNSRLQSRPSEPDTATQPAKRAESIVSGSGPRPAAPTRSAEPRPKPAKPASTDNDDNSGWSIVPGQTQKIR